MGENAIRPPEGDPLAVSRWKVSHRTGGFDVVGTVGPWHEIAYECLHLHDTRTEAVACGKATMPKNSIGPDR